MRGKFTPISQGWKTLAIAMKLIVLSTSAHAIDPSVIAVSPSNGATGVPVITPITVTFNTNMNPFTINSSTIVLRGNGNNVIPSLIIYDPIFRKAIVIPLGILANSTTYKASVSGGNNGVKDIFGNTMKGNYQWSFTTIHAPDFVRPTVKNVDPENGAVGVNLSTAVSVKFSEDMDPATINNTTFQLRDNANNIVPATVSYHVPSKKATLTPSSPLSNSVVYTATVIGGNSGVKDLAGNALAANYSWNFSTPYTIFHSSDAPTVTLITDQPVEVGVKFTTTQNGKILGIRFYKGAGNDGSHVGHLWNSSGTMLAEATFVGESTSGWQEVWFSTPVTINAGAVYIASYYSPLGKYSYTNSYFLNAVVNGPIRALSNGESGGNGVYSYSALPAFPVNSFDATNYFVDVIFVPQGEQGDNDRLGTSNAVTSTQTNSNNNIAEQARKKEIPSASLEVKVMPNPSVDNFSIYLKSADMSTVSVRVTDISGRLVELRDKVVATGVLQLGQTWKTGIYMVEIVQGNQRKVLRLVKAN